MKSEILSFNLNNGYPNVLLLGNGLCRDGGISWKQLLKDTARKGMDTGKYFDSVSGKCLIPNNIYSLATGIQNDAERHRKYSETMQNSCAYIPADLAEVIRMLNLDAILTTNYTYEIENIFCDGYSSFSEKKKRALSFSTIEKGDPKYLIYTYNRPSENACPIWHIHGEARRPSSMILSHDEYIRYIEKIVEHNRKYGRNYEISADNLEMKSWIDYMILGNVYILGFGFDYSELDLWWLLNRCTREKRETGKLIFYEIDDPQDSEKRLKHMVINDIKNAEYRSLGIRKDEWNDNRKDIYHEFYRLALDDIRREIIGKTQIP